MLLSTFELLLKSITPNAGTIPGSDRKILQGYFLNIANPNDFSLNLRLRFNATSPEIDRSQLLVIRDTLGNNVFTNLTSENTFNFRLNPRDTGLIILQPDIRTLNPDTTNLEVRGYVELFVVQRFFAEPGTTYPVLVTPEHRGTFIPANMSGSIAREFDQLISPLPTSTGAGLLDVDVITEPVIINPPNPPFPIPPVELPNLDTISNPDLVGIQQALNYMLGRIEDLSKQVAC